MSVIEVHKWLQLDLAARQRKVREFYASNAADDVHDFLGLVRAPHGYGVYASIGPNYQYAVFGRDSIAVAEDLMSTQPALAREIILLLAHLQGREFNLEREEEQGKIHHEYRALHFNGHEVSKVARMVLEKIGPAWGGTTEELLYFGSYDATPLFIRLVQRYCRSNGDDILSEQVQGLDGVKRSLRVIVREATAWLVGKVTASPWGLFEFRRLNLVGLNNQSWEDSSVAYLHEMGSLANSDDGIAAIELQGYAYDALYGAAELVAADEHEANSWRHLASILRDNTLTRLWSPVTESFAMGLDRDEQGGSRQIKTLTANPGLLLETNLFTRLAHQESWPYVEGVVRSLFSDELFTVAGPRLRGRKYAHLVSFADYHGSQVSWPKHTHRIAEGLRKQCFYRLAALLDSCILHAVAQAGEFYEFFFVDREGRAKYHYRQENPGEPAFHDFGAANLPEPGQAWTISAVLNIVQARHNPAPILPVSDAVRKLEDEILAQKHVAAISAATTHVR